MATLPASPFPARSGPGFASKDASFCAHVGRREFWPHPKSGHLRELETADWCHQRTSGKSEGNARDVRSACLLAPETEPSLLTAGIAKPAVSRHAAAPSPWRATVTRNSSIEAKVSIAPALAKAGEPPTTTMAIPGVMRATPRMASPA